MLLDDRTEARECSSRSSAAPSSPRSEAMSIMNYSDDTRAEGTSSTVQGPSSETYPRKKRKIEPVAVKRQSEYFLGSILVGNAWSTVRGTGYVKSGDLVLVERDTLQDDSKKKGKGKQVTLNSMFKAQAKGVPVKKAKLNTIVRLTNMRGFGTYSLFCIEIGHSHNLYKNLADCLRTSPIGYPSSLIWVRSCLRLRSSSCLCFCRYNQFQRKQNGRLPRKAALWC